MPVVDDDARASACRARARRCASTFRITTNVAHTAVTRERPAPDAVARARRENTEPLALLSASDAAARSGACSAPSSPAGRSARASCSARAASRRRPRARRASRARRAARPRASSCPPRRVPRARRRAARRGRGQRRARAAWRLAPASPCSSWERVDQTPRRSPLARTRPRVRRILGQHRGHARPQLRRKATAAPGKAPGEDQQRVRGRGRRMHSQPSTGSDSANKASASRRGSPPGRDRGELYAERRTAAERREPAPRPATRPASMSARETIPSSSGCASRSRSRPCGGSEPYTSTRVGSARSSRSTISAAVGAGCVVNRRTRRRDAGILRLLRAVLRAAEGSRDDH